MTILGLGVALLALGFAAMALAVCSGHIPALCRALGGAPQQKEETG